MTASGKRRFWTWIAAGSAGVFAISAVAVGLAAQSQYDDLRYRCSPNCPANEVDSVDSKAVAADVLWGFTIASAVAAGVLYWWEGRRGGARILTSTPASVGKVRFAPVVGAGRIGLGATVDY